MPNTYYWNKQEYKTVANWVVEEISPKIDRKLDEKLDRLDEMLAECNRQRRIDTLIGVGVIVGVLAIMTILFLIKG